MKAMTPEQRRLRDEFFASDQWRSLRYVIIKRDGARCAACGRSPRNDGIRIHVDHIQPISLHWHRRLDPSNLQVLCEDCNIGKSNEHEDDWRSKRNENKGPEAPVKLSIENLIEISGSRTALTLTQKQAEVLRIKWPLKSGWVKRLMGRMVRRSDWNELKRIRLEKTERRWRNKMQTNEHATPCKS